MILVQAGGLYDSLRDRQQRMVITSLLRDAKRVAAIMVEHRALTDAIRAGERERAQSVLTEAPALARTT